MINLLESKGKKGEVTIMQLNYMRGLRINQGRKFKDNLDKYDGAVYDTSHFISAHVIMYHLSKRVRQRKREELVN